MPLPKTKQRKGAQMIERASRLIPACLCLVVPTFLLCGCGSQQTTATYMHPERLYLADRPYARLHIEVDRVEGAEVPQAWLDGLEAFFAEHCNKPGGITMARDEPIPLSCVKDLTIAEAALLCTDGPPLEGDEQPAYVHVFFYDLDQGLSAVSRDPHVLLYCPTTIFYNTGRLRQLPDCIHVDRLRHEAGHVLGLCHNRSHGDGVHCRSYGCLMRRKAEELSSLTRIVGAHLGLKPDPCPLCQHCLRDLGAPRAADRDESLSFAGPFLVRREEGYAVVRLPQCELVMPSEGTFEWREALESARSRVSGSVTEQTKIAGDPVGDGRQPVARARPRKVPGKGQAMFFFRVLPARDMGSSRSARDQQLALLAKASEDPCPVTRRLVRYALASMEKNPAPAQTTVATKDQ